MKRRAHLLKPTTGAERPTSVIFFDTETEQDKDKAGVITHTLKVGVAQHYRNLSGEALRYQSEIVFKRNPDLWEYVDRTVREKSTTYLVAHNIVFDLTVTHGFSSLAARGWKLDGFYSKGVVSLFRWSKGERRLLGVDNSNLFAGKLAKWGDIFKMPKLKVDFETVDDDDLIVYCRRDVEVMVTSWRSWLAFLDEHKLGNFKPTVGSTALSSWRARFMDAKVFIHDDPLALRLEREAYKGGRVECFYKGTIERGDFYYLDVNNMYGYVLSRYQYPAGIWGSHDTNDLSMLIRKLADYAVVARVGIDVTEPWFPISLNGRTCYPVGSFETTLTTPELMLCYQRGWLRSVSSMAWYRQAPLFSGYVQYFYHLRQTYNAQGNTGYAAICKLLVNSLYGKFGQTGLDQKVIGERPLDETWSQTVKDIDSGEIFRMYALGGRVFEERKSGESSNSAPAIAAHVTAYARLYLYRLIRSVDPHHVYYCDTDSLIVDHHGMRQLRAIMDEKRLGALKIELRSPWLEINAPKDYRMKGRARLKGVKPNAVHLIGGIYVQEQWERFAGKVRAGTLDGFKVRPLVKRQHRQITSGVLLPSGWIEPLHLEPGASAGVVLPSRSAVETGRPDGSLK